MPTQTLGSPEIADESRLGERLGPSLISIIIPLYGCEDLIDDLLDSIEPQLDEGFELILVDDCSVDRTAERMRAHSIVSKAHLARTPENSGPAVARNLGASLAKGDGLLFFDSDVVLLPDTLKRVRGYLARYPEVRCFTGINTKPSAARGLVSEFHSMYSYYTLNLIPENGTASTWNPRLGYIEKDLFEESGGFEARYRGADVEDFELSQRLSDVTQIYFTRELELRHHFFNMKDATTSFFKRSSMWIQLLLRNRKFDRTGHTRVSNVPNLLVSFLLFASIAMLPFFSTGLLVLGLFGAHLGLNYPLFRFFVREAGLVKGFVYLFLVAYFFVVAEAGIVLGLITYPFRGKKPLADPGQEE